MRSLIFTFFFALAGTLYAPPYRPPCLTSLDDVVNSESPPEFVRGLFQNFDTWDMLPVYTDS